MMEAFSYFIDKLYHIIYGLKGEAKSILGQFRKKNQIEHSFKTFCFSQIKAVSANRRFIILSLVSSKRTNISLLFIILSFWIINIPMISSAPLSLRQRRNQKLDGLRESIKGLAATQKLGLAQEAPKRKESMSSVGTPLLQSLNPFEDEDNDSPSNPFQASYRLEEKIGEGAHGVVKRCTHRKNVKQFAVKILKMEDEHFHGLKTNFISMKQLRHECLVKYKALYLNSKKRICHLVMEYFPFKHLKAPMDEQTLRSIFHRVLDGLAYIHSKGVCHRDIKPENILYDSKTELVKIIDFGISKNMKLRGRYEEMLTHTGTEFYKAPQMFLGGGYTEKVDSWAVGICLYELINGMTPFASEYHSDTIENILNKDIDTEQGNLRNCSALLKNLILRLLKKNSKERLSCAQAREHIWFTPPAHYINLMKSDFGFKNIPDYRSEEKLDVSDMMRRRCSVNEIEPQQLEVSKSEKENIKRWLSIVSQDDGHHHDSEDEFRFDLIESDDEDSKKLEKKKISAPSIEKIKFEDTEELAATVK